MNYFLIIVSYFIGSIPFGLVFGKIAGIDVRKDGSGNIGATNVSRLVGKKIGALTLVLDAAKGFVPMLVAGYLGAELSTVMFCGAAAFWGHLFPVYLRFKGGKGVATALGVFLYLSPMALVICAVGFFIAVVLSGYVSAGSLLASGLMPVVIFWQQGAGNYFYLALFVTVLIWFKHSSNIVRLLKGQEKSWRKK